MIDLRTKKILITDGAGFFGKYVVKRLVEIGVKKLFIPKLQNFDLRKLNDCMKITRNMEVVIHTAGNTGGISFNKNFPGTAFYDNLLIGSQLMEAARLSRVEKFVALGTVSCYPKFTPIPFKEENLWNGYPDETNAPYGLAKKMLLVQSRAYRQQYNFNSIFLIPANPYGPGDDGDKENSHVIPALITKFIEAKENGEKNVVVWGTGKATREFLFIEDAAEAILLATEKYNKDIPINIGSGFEINIKNLAKKIAELVKYQEKISWDHSKPDGQPRRSLDVTKAYKEFGFKAKTNFDEGLKKTVKWYLNNSPNRSSG